MVAKRAATKAKKADQDKNAEAPFREPGTINLDSDEPAEPIIKPDPANGAGIKEGPGVLPGSRLVEVKEDIFEDKAVPGSTETTRVLVARAGQLLPQTQIDDLKERGVL